MQYNANYDLMSRNGQLGMTHGPRGIQASIKPYDPAGESVRRLVKTAPDTSLDPFVNRMPNKAYGEAYGLEWDGQRWVKANPNADLERQALELELEKRRQDMEQAKYGGGPDSAVAAWLSRRLGG